MNKSRRESLRRASSLLTQANQIIDMACSQESDYLDNIPENMQSGDRYEKAETAVSELENALDCVSNAIDHVSVAMA